MLEIPKIKYSEVYSHYAMHDNYEWKTKGPRIIIVAEGAPINSEMKDI